MRLLVMAALAAMLPAWFAPVLPAPMQPLRMLQGEWREAGSISAFDPPPSQVEVRKSQHQVPIKMLADYLSGVLGRPVTNDTAMYFNLEWTPDSPAQPSPDELVSATVVHRSLPLSRNNPYCGSNRGSALCPYTLSRDRKVWRKRKRLFSVGVR
jgi:hypothetical protein